MIKHGKHLSKTLLAAGLMAVLAGCSSNVKHSCPLPESCAPIHDVYKSAVRDESPDGFTVYPKAVRMEKKESDDKAQLVDGLFEDGASVSEDEKDKKRVRKKVKVQFKAGVTPGIDANGAVWHPPQPYWVWLAHWVDDTGVLHSGSYAWFTSKGYWTIDGVRVEGSAEMTPANGEEQADFAPAWIPDAPVSGNGGAQGSSFTLKDVVKDVKGAANELTGSQGTDGNGSNAANISGMLQQ